MTKIFPAILFISLIVLAHPQAVFAAANGGFTQAPSNGAGFTFTFGQQKFPVSKEIVASWQNPQAIGAENIFVQPPEPLKNSISKFIGLPVASLDLSKNYHYNLGNIYAYIQNLSKTINATTTEPSLKIQDNKVIKFSPPQPGLETDVYKSTFDALWALEAGKGEIELSVAQTDPKNSLADTNTLGINGLIAEGVSNFKGSPNNRRHNIAVGVQKFKGVIVPKGATFSFDDNLGPVEAEQGFLPELVIKSTGTVPEFGGGLCQVSTTTFRAAMLAGLPITQRKNHAYAVQYYFPQGTDATIYPGSADLKFVNDTPGAILIWPYEKDKDTLVFDFYGTNDGRKVTLETPVVTDKKTDGSMKASWTRQVVGADGTPRTDVFKSVYQPPALFHKTETFVSATGATTAPNGFYVGTP